MPIFLTTNTADLGSAAGAAEKLNTLYPSKVCLYQEPGDPNCIIVIQASHVEIEIAQGRKKQEEYLAEMQQLLESLGYAVSLTKFERLAFLPIRRISKFYTLAVQLRLSLVLERDPEHAEISKGEFAKQFRAEYFSDCLTQVIYPRFQENLQFEIRVEGKAIFGEVDAEKLRLCIAEILTAKKGYALVSLECKAASLHNKDYRVRGHVYTSMLDVNHRFNPIFYESDSKAEWKAMESKSTRISLANTVVVRYHCDARVFEERQVEAPANPSVSFCFRSLSRGNDPRRRAEFTSDVQLVKGYLLELLREKFRIGPESECMVHLSVDDFGYSSFIIERSNLYIDPEEKSRFMRLVFNLLDERQLSTTYQLNSINVSKGGIDERSRNAVTVTAPPEEHVDIKFIERDNPLQKRLEAAGLDVGRVPEQYLCKLGRVIMEEPAYNQVTGATRHHCELRPLAYNNAKSGTCAFSRSPILDDSLCLDAGLRNEILTYVACVEYIKTKGLDVALLDAIVENKHSLYWLKEQHGDDINACTAVEAYEKGRAHYKNGEYREAIYCFQLALTKAGDNTAQTAILEYNLGASYLLLENFDAASTHLGRVKDFDEHAAEPALKHVKHLFKLVYALGKLKNFEQVELLFARVAELGERLKTKITPQEYLDIYLSIATQYAAMGLMDDSVTACRKVLELIPADFNSQYREKVSQLLKEYQLKTDKVKAGFTAVQAMWRGYKVREITTAGKIRGESDMPGAPKLQNTIEVRFIVTADEQLFPAPPRTASRRGHDPFAMMRRGHAEAFHRHSGHHLSAHPGRRVGMGASDFDDPFGRSHGHYGGFGGMGMDPDEFDDTLTYSHLGHGGFDHDDIDAFLNPPVNPFIENVISQEVCQVVSQRCGLAVMNKLTVCFLRDLTSKIVAFDLRFEDLHFPHDGDVFVNFIKQVKDAVESMLYESRKFFSYESSTVHRFTKGPVEMLQATYANVRTFQATRESFKHDARGKKTEAIFDFTPR